MKNRKYTEEHLKEWSEEHFPQVDNTSDDVELEKKLRTVLIEGSAYFDKYPISTNKTLHKLLPKNKYKRYFANRAKIEFLGYENFHYLCENGGSKYTNEYIFTTLLREHVSEAIITESEKLLVTFAK